MGTLVLKEEPETLKALYRRAAGMYGLGAERETSRAPTPEHGVARDLVLLFLLRRR